MFQALMVRLMGEGLQTLVVIVTPVQVCAITTLILPQVTGAAYMVSSA